MTALRRRKRGFKMQVGRMGAGMDEVETDGEESLKKLLDDNGYVAGDKEKVFLNGDPIAKSDLKKTFPTKNSVVVLVGAKEGGNR